MLLATMAALTFLTLGGTPAAAQTPDSIHSAVVPGARVRLADPRGRMQGTVESVGPDGVSVRFRQIPEPLLVRGAGLGDLEVSTGRRSNAGGGFKSGFIVGAGLGLLVGTLACWCENDEVASAVLGSAIGGGFTFGMIGAIIGAAAGTEDWASVRRPEPVVTVEPTLSKGGGVRVSVSLPTR
jgi:hypothetical protein